MADTSMQFDAVVAQCRSLFSNKLHDYDTAWRILRPESVTDQLFIKASRIRSLEIKGEARVQEGIRPEYIGIVNYGAIALIQFELGFAEYLDMTPEEALSQFDTKLAMAKTLMMDKNHDYDEAWRSMRIESYTDLILMKLQRIKKIEELAGQTLGSESIDANYLDIINYAIFALIRLEFDQ